MNRIQIVCYALLASAFVLAGLLMTSLHQSAESTAHASLVLSRGNLTIMTARTANEEESLFILDNVSQTLLVYNVDVARKRLELLGAGDLRQIFGTVDGGGDRRPQR